MKALLSCSLIVAAAMSLGASGKKHVPATQTPVPLGIISCKVNGKPWISKSMGMATGTGIISDQMGMKSCQISGGSGNMNAMTNLGITLLDYHGVGTYTNVPTSETSLPPASVLWGEKGGSEAFSDTEYGSETVSTVTITEVKGKIVKGTFKSKVKSIRSDTERTLTEGAFHVKMM